MSETTPETDSPSMLLSFTGSNVRSFRDSFTISMLATRMSEPAIARPIPWREGGQPLDVLPVALVLGSNASGKSNLLRAMADLRSLVLHSFRSGDPTGGVPRRRFLLDDESAKSPTSFEIDLVLHGVRHVYSIAVNDERIVTERAVRFPKGKESLLFSRDKDTVEFGPAMKTRGRLIAELLRPNSAFLSTAAATNDETLLPLFKWFSRNLWIAEARNRHLRLARSAEMFNDPATAKRARALLQVADLGVTGVTKKPIDPETRERIKRAVAILNGRDGEETTTEENFKVEEFGIALQHRAGDHSCELDNNDESLGTLVWLGLLGPVLDALDQGRVLLADELDASLHPILVERIVKLFQNPETNPNRAQLISNAHDLNLVNSTSDRRLVGRDQVWFTEKHADGNTALYPLIDFDPRRDENVSRRYLQGMYGGIPIVSDAEFAAVLAESSESVGAS